MGLKEPQRTRQRGVLFGSSITRFRRDLGNWYVCSSVGMGSRASEDAIVLAVEGEEGEDVDDGGARSEADIVNERWFIKLRVDRSRDSEDGLSSTQCNRE